MSMPDNMKQLATYPSNESTKHSDDVMALTTVYYKFNNG